MLRAILTGLAVSIVVLPASAAAQAKQPLTHELLWSFQRVGAPVPSPDGRWVVFQVSEPSYDEKKEVSDLWIVPADASAKPRRLTSNRGGESGPAWSPDSSRIAFSARRDDDEVAQIYVLDVARGGDAQRATSAPTAARSPRWSPDGTKILFQATRWPEARDEDTNRTAAQERKNAKSKVRTFDTFPIRNWDHWADDAKPDLWVVSVDGDRKARSLLAGSSLAARPGFGADSLSPSWTPDGQAVVFAAPERGETAARAIVLGYLWQVPLAGGEPTKLTADNADVGGPEFRPDGKALCFRVSDPAPAIYHLTGIACGAWPWTGAWQRVTGDFDRDVASWAFSPDSLKIYLTAEDTGHERIYAVPATGGKVTLAADPREGVYTSIAVPSRSKTTAIFASWDSAVNPAEVVRVDPATASRTLLSTFNVEKAASIDWQPVREFWSTAPNGSRIHSFLVVPATFDESRKYPLFVVIHGGHANMWRDSITYRWNYHLLSQPGFVILLTDYRGSTGYGEKFTLDILGDPLKGPADDLNDAADEAIAKYPFIDGARQAAGGASYGGHLANWLAVTSTRYKALVSHAGLATLDQQWGTSDGIYHRELMMGGPFWENPQKWNEQSPLAKAGGARTPTLFSVSDNDYRVPLNNTLTMYAALQRMNVPTRLLVWPDENHWILKGENSRVFYREVRAWLEKYLLNGAAAPSSR